MKQQSDWFTGIDYYDQYKEKEIVVETCILQQDRELHRHIQVELWYVHDGEGKIQVNGEIYPLKEHSFLCMYAHHLYSVHIIKPVKVTIVRFYIGVFMHMMWEKHERGKNAQLVYETKPYLYCEDPYIKECMERLIQEYEHKQFGSRNMVLYLVMEVHMLFCRYALQQVDAGRKRDQLWSYIQQIIVSPTHLMSLEDIAMDLNRNPHYVNQMIIKRCGYSYKELTQFAKIINACALLHFEELSISYISDLLGFESMATFYRVFEAYTGTKPMQYQKDRILDEGHLYTRKDLFLQIEQYLYLNFYKQIKEEDVALALDVKPYTISTLMKNEYETSVYQELCRIRIQYACALLKATTMSITQIAMDCGFESIATFQRVFQKETGLLPSTYQNLQK